MSFENQKDLGIVHSLEFFAPLIFAQIRAKVRKTVLKITSYEVRNSIWLCSMRKCLQMIIVWMLITGDFIGGVNYGIAVGRRTEFQSVEPQEIVPGRVPDWAAMEIWRSLSLHKNCSDSCSRGWSKRAARGRRMLRSEGCEWSDDHTQE